MSEWFINSKALWDMEQAGQKRALSKCDTFQEVDTSEAGCEGKPGDTTD